MAKFKKHLHLLCQLLVITWAAAAFVPLSIEGDEPDLSYVVPGDICLDSRGLIFVDNSDGFQKDMAFSKDGAYIETIMVKSLRMLVMSLDKSKFPADSTLTFSVTSDGFTRDIGVRVNPVITGVSLNYARDVQTDLVSTHQATAQAGVFVDFQFKILSVDQSMSVVQDITSPAVGLESRSASHNFQWSQPGHYLINVTASSACYGPSQSIGYDMYLYHEIQPSVRDTDYKITTNRKDVDTFYPMDTVGLSLKVKDGENLKIRKPTQVTCILDWGDGHAAVTEVGPDLTANNTTRRIYAKSHVYEVTGSFTATISCSNPISSAYAEIHFKIISPLDHTDAALENYETPFDHVTRNGNGTVVIIQDYLYEDYPYLKISIDFDLPDEFISFHFLYNTKRFSRVYPAKRYHRLSVVFRAFGLTKEKVLILKVGVIDFYVNQLSIATKLNESTLFKLVRFNSTGTMNVLLNMDPGIVNEVFTSGLVNINVTRVYSVDGQKTATASVNVKGILEIVSFSFGVFESCLSNKDLFESTFRNESAPLITKLSIVPTISGRAERSPLCDDTDVIEFYWQLWKNVGTYLVTNWAVVPVVQPNSSAIVLKYFTIEPGLYKIRLEVSIRGKPGTIADVMHINASSPTLVVKMNGASFRQIQKENDVSLDALSLSYDPIMMTPAKSQLNFTWACFFLLLRNDIPKYTQQYNSDQSYRNLTQCGLTFPYEGKVTVSTSTLPAGTLVLFEVTASKDERMTSAVQVVEMLSGQIPLVAIECQWNCLSKLLTDERAVFRVTINCSGCSDDEVNAAYYRWSLFKYDKDNGTSYEIPEDLWDNIIISKPTDKTFDSKGGWWEQAAIYTLEVQVKIVSYPEVKAILTIYTDLKPYHGQCYVEPTEGIAMETKFTFSFKDWKDEGERPFRNPNIDTYYGLWYQVQQRAEIITPVIYSGGDLSTPRTCLIECGTANDNCPVEISVIDTFGSKSVCTVNVKVSRYANVKMEASEESKVHNVSALIKDIEKMINFSVLLQDPVKTSQDVASLSTVLLVLGNDLRDIPDSTVFNPANISTDSGLTKLLDPLTVVMPSRMVVIEALSYHTNIIGQSIDLAKERGIIDSPVQIEIFARSLVTITTDTALLSGPSLSSATDSLLKLSDHLKGQANNQQIPGGITNCLSAFEHLIHNVIEAQAINTSQLYALTDKIESDSPLSDIEDAYFAKLEAKRTQYQENSKILKAKETVKNLRNIWDNTIDMMTTIANPEGRYETKEKSFTMAVQKTTIKDIFNNTAVHGSEGPFLGFLFESTDIEDNSTDVSAVAIRTKNIYIHGPDSRRINSDILIGYVRMENGNQSMLTNPKVVFQTKESGCGVREDLKTIKPKFISGDASQMFYHSFLYLDSNSHLCFKVRVDNPALFFRLYLRMGYEPSDIYYDFRESLTHDLLKPCGELCIQPGKIKKTGLGFIGLRPFIDDTLTQSQNRKKREAPIDPLLASYRFGVTTVACYSWDHKEVNWIASQCKVIEYNAMKKENGSVICTCQNGPEIINGLSFNFQPNAIHFAKVFSKFDIKGQGLVIGLLLGIYFLFTLIVIWAHYTERKGVFQWGVFPLADNYAADDYFYLVTVSTGLRTFSGTKSNVSFCLSGEKEETGVRKLSDGVREGFPTASVYHFVMACPRSLGYIQCMRLWHDNSGKGNDASWYLDHIDVMDIQTGEFYHFVCEEWLTPENKSSDKVIANVEDLITLRSMFFSYGKKHITEEHIWISVFVRPQRSRFSRAERVGCCLCFLILAMITSAMFYSGVPDFDRQQSSEDFKIGPIRLSFQQLYYSMVSAFITTLPLGIIMTLFRRSRRYFTESNTLSDIVEQTDRTWATSMSTSEHFDPLATKASINNVTKIKKKTSSCLPWIRKLEQQLEELDKILMSRPDAEELSGTISHRWRYLAWFVVFITVTSCSFFVILYTMEWGQDVTESWLSTFFLTFIESVFIVDPFKVVILSALLAIFLRKSQVKSLNKLNLNLISFINKEYGIKEMPDPPRMSVSFASSFSDEEIELATLKRKVHLMIRKILKELAIHFIFLLIVSSLCYSTHNNHDYGMYKLIRTELVDDKNAGFMYVNSSLKYFDWISESLVPWLFPVKDSMGHSIVSEDRQYTKVWDLYRLGAPRIRQLRIKTDMCPSRIVPFKDCIPEYDIFTEETGEFCLGWSKTPCPQVDQLRVTADAWHYQTEESIWGIPIAGSYDVYGGGGYIANLDINLMVAKAIVKEMKQHSWIDRHTRAVFIEFTLYCPGINHFVNVLLLAEFIDTGGMVPFVSAYPFTIHHPSGALGTYYQICEIIGIGKTAIGIVYVIFVLWKKRCAALKEFWFVLDLIGVIVAVFTVIIFCLRNSYADTALKKMQKDRTLFINFYQVVVWDFIFMICLSMLSVIGCLRLLKLAGYSQRTMKVYYVLKEATKTLPSFFSYILLILMVFAMVGYILFSRTSEYFKSFIACIETLFTGLLGHSGFKETNLPISEKWITILFFCLFVIFVVVLLTNFFLAILLDMLTASAQVKCAATRPENSLVFIVLWDSILKALGSKRDPQDRLRDNTEQEGTITTEADYFTYLDDQLEKLSKLSISDDRRREILLQCIVLAEKKKINGDANETAI